MMGIAIFKSDLPASLAEKPSDAAFSYGRHWVSDNATPETRNWRYSQRLTDIEVSEHGRWRISRRNAMLTPGMVSAKSAFLKFLF
jgi:hypothetical protein